MIMIAKETGFIIEFTYKNSRKLLNRNTSDVVMRQHLVSDGKSQDYIRYKRGERFKGA